MFDLIGKIFTAFTKTIVMFFEGLEKYMEAFKTTGEATNAYAKTLIPSDEDYSKAMELAKQQRQLNLTEKEADLEMQLEKFNKSRKPKDTNKPTNPNP